MTKPCRLRSLALLMTLVLCSLPQRASADLESCTDAHASGQREENAGRLKEALASFQECASDAACPLPIRNECTELYTTVEGRLPTLVFSVVDGSGNDVVDVRVSSADEQIAEGLDGRPIPVNPGLHEFRLQLPSGEVLTKSVVVRQGEKDRIVALKLLPDDLPASPAGGGGPLTAPAQGETARSLRVPMGAWISYGVGVAALASWGSFALLGRSAEQGLVECSPNCQETRRGDYDAMKRDYLIADVSLGVAGAAVLAGTIIVLTTGRKPESARDLTRASAERPLSVAPNLGRFGGGLTLKARY